MSATPRRALDQWMIWTGSLAVVIGVPAAVVLHNPWLIVAAGIGWCVQHLGWFRHNRRFGGAA